LKKKRLVERHIMPLESPTFLDDPASYAVWNVWVPSIQGQTGTATGAFTGGESWIGPSILPQPTPSGGVGLSQTIIVLPPLPSFNRQEGYFSGVGYEETHWFSPTSYDSPPLTDEEIRDITKSWEEIRTGKSKKFDNARDAIEWLRSQRAKHRQ